MIMSTIDPNFDPNHASQVEEEEEDEEEEEEAASEYVAPPSHSVYM
jgi:hypothetical protein